MLYCCFLRRCLFLFVACCFCFLVLCVFLFCCFAVVVFEIFLDVFGYMLSISLGLSNCTLYYCYELLMYALPKTAKRITRTARSHDFSCARMKQRQQTNQRYTTKHSKHIPQIYQAYIKINPDVSEIYNRERAALGLGRAGCRSVFCVTLCVCL